LCSAWAPQQLHELVLLADQLSARSKREIEAHTDELGDTNAAVLRGAEDLGAVMLEWRALGWRARAPR
jgi:hypothetical protein